VAPGSFYLFVILVDVTTASNEDLSKMANLHYFFGEIHTKTCHATAGTLLATDN